MRTIRLHSPGARLRWADIQIDGNGARPVAYFAMQRWLAGFAYRIELGPLVFVARGVLALVVAMLTVALVATRAARAKPITALRYE